MGTFSDILGGVGDVAGSFMGGDDRDRARGYLDANAAGWKGLTPQIEAQQAGPSAYNTADPAGRSAQLEALSQLRNQYNSGGLDAISQGRMADIGQQTQQAAQQSQQAVMQDAARRGVANGGNTLVAQQIAGQQAAQAGAQQGRDVAAAAQQGRMQAIQGAGQLATGVRGQDYERAAANDAIGRFNANQRQNAQVQTQQGNFQRQAGLSGAYGAQYSGAMGDAQRLQGVAHGVGTAVGGGVDAYFAGGGG